MADNNKKFDIKSYYNDLTRLFKSGPVVRQRIANKIAAPGQVGIPVGTARAFLSNVNNSFASAMASYGSYNRLARYSDYAEMESMAELASALDIYADEICATGDDGEILRIDSPNSKIKEILNVFFYDTLNIEFNAHTWMRNLCKYGDYFLLVDHHPDYGVLSCFPLPVNEVEREEGYDKDNPLAYRYRWVTQGNRVLENWEVIHFRLMGTDNFIPYGMSVLEPARRVWRQLILMEDAIMVYRIVRSPERRVFYLDVGGIAPQDVPAFMEKAKSSLKRNQIVDNSTGRVDLRYNPLCVHLNTAIPLMDGRTLTLDSLIKEWESGKQDQWVYSIDRDNDQLVPGKISWAGITRKNADLVRVHLDNGTWVDTTPDHKFMLRNKDYVEAKDLKPNDALMPLYRKQRRISSTERGQLYWQTYDPFTEKYEYDHKIVANNLLSKELEIAKECLEKDNKYMIVHHKNFKATNNSPENLQWIGNKDHADYHRDLLVAYNKSDKHRQKVSEANKKFKKAEKMSAMYNGTELHKSHNSIRKEAQLNSWATNKEKRSKAMEFVIPDECIELGKVIYKDNPNLNRENFIDCFNNNECIKKILEESNKHTNRNANKVSRFVIEKKLNELGYSGFVEFKKKCLEEVVGYKNHKVVRVEFLSEKVDTGCITVDNYHNFATSGDINCLIGDVNLNEGGVFIKNSTDEDYFLPVRGEASSRIDSLPGGQFTGDIDDLMYIQNKLFAALKIPKSYLGYESDIGAKSTLSQLDVRFARTIKRMQRVFLAELKKLAIIHLHAYGLRGEDLLNFDLTMANPSMISDLQRLELWRNKFEVASMAGEGNFDREFMYKKLFKLDRKDIEGIEEGKRKDKLFELELESIQLGNAPPAPMAAPPIEGGAPVGGGATLGAAGTPNAGLPPPPGELDFSQPGQAQGGGLDTASKDPMMQSAAPNELMMTNTDKKPNKSQFPDLKNYVFNLEKTALDPKRNASELTRLVRAPFGEGSEDTGETENKLMDARLLQLRKFAEDLENNPALNIRTKKLISE